MDFTMNSATLMHNPERSRRTKTRLCPAFPPTSSCRAFRRKLLIAMKLTSILLLAACLQVSAHGFSQVVTISEKNAPLEKVFSIIEKQTGYTFYYKIELLQRAGKVNITIKNATIDKVLETLFKDQPLTYNIVEKNIVVKEKEAPRKIEEAAEAPTVEIKGFVVSENGVVAGANVVIKRTGKGTSANGKGEFRLTDVNDDDILVVSSIGYQTQEVPLKDKKGFVYVQLKVSVDKLDEIQILAYGGATTRRLNTGSVSRITGEEIAKQPVTNVLQALVGRTAGMSISQSNGLAGGDVTFQIRGQNSVNNDA